ncbi:GNAT family N-acetyltransferase [Patescibacteria group bacterium]|nr:GNAT family N-acetyltransferase [Patescibacteria group bacterium]MBU4511802.1 GNAT family N-acetyltransferase [Patescibacteria group bacterium]
MNPHKKLKKTTIKNQQNPEWEILKWDTDFFGFTVAKIIPNKLNLNSLKKILTSLRKSRVSLVYWASDSTDEASQKAAETLNGFLADRKVIYIINLKKIPVKHLQLNIKVEEHNKNLPNTELKNLAIQAGLYSRYNVDQKISKKKFEALYKIWITNSLNKTIADAVLVTKKKGKIVGMITLGKKNNRGDIGLIAVSPNARGMGLGTSLVKSAQSWFISHKYKFGQVITQEANTAACRLYEKCGYRLEKKENFYHFWL